MDKFNGVALRCNPLWYVISALFIFSFLSFWGGFPLVMLDQNVAHWSAKYHVYPISFDTPIPIPSENQAVSPSTTDNSSRVPVSNKTDGLGCGEENFCDPCSGRYVYVHNLPSKFNTGLLKECRNLNLWTDMCLRLSNRGMGPKIENSKGFFPRKGWFSTDQFALDVIFHNRMKQYKCLTDNSSLASAIYVPFYAGLDIGRYLWGFNTSIRDSTSHDLVKWLANSPEWKVMGGRDHFLVGGRVTWDFRRRTNVDLDWGNNLMLTPQANNMSALLIESSPWYDNEYAIPYPTYFHPSTNNEVSQWQNRMRKHKKRYLFSFAGVPRPKQLGSIRGHIIEQCRASKGLCKLLECYKHGDSCQPTYVMQLFQDSVFCIQPPGDSYTRKSSFDSILAGCIPVFFHPESAYTQYIWHLPQNYQDYSVFIPENQIKNGKISIAQTLSQIPKEKVKAMKEAVISLIPNIIYADSTSRLETLEDAFDISVRRIIQTVNEVRRGQQGR